MSEKIFPVQNEEFKFRVPIRSFDTGNPVSGGLTGLALSISKDDDAFAAATGTVVEIGTSGIVVVTLSAADMNANSIFVVISATNIDALEYCIEIVPIPQEVGAPALGDPLERWLMFVCEYFANENVKNGINLTIASRATPGTNVATALVVEPDSGASTKGAFTSP